MLKVSTLSGEHQVLLYATHDFARDHVVTGQAFLSMQFDKIPADILLYLLECLELEDVLLLLSVRGHLRSHVHRPDVPDRAENPRFAPDYEDCQTIGCSGFGFCGESNPTTLGSSRVHYNKIYFSIVCPISRRSPAIPPVSKRIGLERIRALLARYALSNAGGSKGLCRFWRQSLERTFLCCTLLCNSFA
jgi:hypothetical protein